MPTEFAAALTTAQDQVLAIATGVLVPIGAVAIAWLSVKLLPRVIGFFGRTR